MAASATEEQISLRVLVHKGKNRVVYVRAEKDFVDILLSFLTLPLGTIARLVAKESNINKVNLGSLSSLYESVGNLEEMHFWTDTCKEMLLQPRNPLESYCQNLKFNIDDTEKTQHFICENYVCSQHFGEPRGLLSTFRNQRCKCGKLMNRVIHLLSSSVANEGFVPETATVVISDDLKVFPDQFEFSSLPINLIYEDFDAIDIINMNVTQKEILDLLKCSLLSTTPLTDVLLHKKQVVENAQASSVLDFDFGIGDLEANSGGQVMKLKVILRKSNRSILYALTEEDFVDFIFSFLTLPLGGVEHMLNGNSCLGSIDNLYKSMLEFDCHRDLTSQNLKDKLVKTPLAYQFKLRNKILPIDEMPPSNYSCYLKFDHHAKVPSTSYLTALQSDKFKIGPSYVETYASLNYLEPQSSKGEAYNENGGRGFVRRSSLYMVTDDLVVTPSSSISAISYATKLGVPRADLEEIAINIGQKEALNLLKASLISSSTLTNGLSQFF